MSRLGITHAMAGVGGAELAIDVDQHFVLGSLGRFAPAAARWAAFARWTLRCSAPAAARLLRRAGLCAAAKRA